jgi:hypothetical protein
MMIKLFAGSNTHYGYSKKSKIMYILFEMIHRVSIPKRAGITHRKVGYLSPRRRCPYICNSNFKMRYHSLHKIKDPKLFSLGFTGLIDNILFTSAMNYFDLTVLKEKKIRDFKKLFFSHRLYVIRQSNLLSVFLFSNGKCIWPFTKI